MEGRRKRRPTTKSSDQLFLRLAGLGPKLRPPATRVRSGCWRNPGPDATRLTLVFELDPRARWHDGVPVTSRDVVFTMERARNPAIAPRVAKLLRHITSVDGRGRANGGVPLSRAYAEQLYDATFHTATASRASAGFACHPTAVEPVELRLASGRQRAVPVGPQRAGATGGACRQSAVLPGRPKIERVIVRVAKDADARLNMVLSGQADAMDNHPLARRPTPPGGGRPDAPAHHRAVALTWATCSSISGIPSNRTQPHPILADMRVRRAMTLGLDRRLMVQAVFGAYGMVPYGPVSPLLWIRHGAPPPAGQDRAEARAAARSARLGGLGRRRHARPRGPAAPASALASQHQRDPAADVSAGSAAASAGRRADRDASSSSSRSYMERRTAGDFDIDFSAVAPGPFSFGPDAELVLHRVQQRRRILRSRRWTR